MWLHVNLRSVLWTLGLITGPVEMALGMAPPDTTDKVPTGDAGVPPSPRHPAPPPQTWLPPAARAMCGHKRPCQCPVPNQPGATRCRSPTPSPAPGTLGQGSAISPGHRSAPGSGQWQDRPAGVRDRMETPQAPAHPVSPQQPAWGSFLCPGPAVLSSGHHTPPKAASTDPPEGKRASAESYEALTAHRPRLCKHILQVRSAPL